MFYNRHLSKAGFNVSINTAPSPPSSSEPTTVPIKFVLKTVHSYYRKPYRRPRVLEQQFLKVKPSLDFIDHHTLLSCPKHSRNLISHNLSRLGIPLRYHSQISKEFISCGPRVSGGDSVVTVEVKLVEEYIHDETQSETELLDGEESGMVAASESSIKGLKRKRIACDDDDDDEEEGERSKTGSAAATTCVVCFEDMVMGEEATCMPCSHLFHGGCITRWLKTSHCCPVCRFELPTA